MDHCANILSNNPADLTERSRTEESVMARKDADELLGIMSVGDASG